MIVHCDFKYKPYFPNFVSKTENVQRLFFIETPAAVLEQTPFYLVLEASLRDTLCWHKDTK